MLGSLGYHLKIHKEIISLLLFLKLILTYLLTSTMHFSFAKLKVEIDSS